MRSEIPRGDLRERIRGQRRSVSRSQSYSPPPPPSHPSRQTARSLTKHPAGRKERSRSPSLRVRSVTKHSTARRERSRSRSYKGKSVTRHKSRRQGRSPSSSGGSVKAKSRSKKHHKKKKKYRRRSGDFSDSASDREDSRVTYKDLKRTVVSLLSDSGDMTDSSRLKLKKRTKSGESHSSRDEPSTSVSDEKRMKISESFNLENPIKPSAEFRPLPVQGNDLVGYIKCQICSTYYHDDAEEEKQHLSQHPDRLFLLKVPTDTFLYSIEEVIKKLARMNFIKTEIKEKVKQNNLLQLPTNLRGYSCNLCNLLDTNDEKVFQTHMREVCRVRDKAERKNHLICFCRGCQVKSFSSHFPRNHFLYFHREDLSPAMP